MKTLAELLQNISTLRRQGDLDREIPDFQFDSRATGAGDLFVAIRGSASDGHAYIGKAIAAGAGAILCQDWPESLPTDYPCVQVEDPREALARIAANFYGNPAAQLKVVGITGTNGKTSVATLLHGLFSSLGYRCGLVSTIRYLIGTDEYPASHTTPDPKQLHAAFAKMAEAGCTHCFMEVSSHALDQRRTEGIPFSAAVFTNLTHDHLDYHGSFANYLKAKKRLFDGLSPQAVALVNADDRNGKVMVQNCAARIRSFGVQRPADYHARIIENTFEGLQLDLEGRTAWFRLVGSFNASNLLAAYSVAVELGVEPEEALRALSAMPGVEGRFQVLRSRDEVTAIVDYAHTPDALASVLDTVHDVNRGQGKVIAVAGCGGNRDAAKRPKMGLIAAQRADRSIFTSDNPRFEAPGDIIRQMLEGVPADLRHKVLSVEDRREAIRMANALAQRGDIILIAGKGHETYQEIQGLKHPFDDREVIRQAWAESGRAMPAMSPDVQPPIPN